jgi:hypothetical protein
LGGGARRASVPWASPSVGGTEDVQCPKADRLHRNGLGRLKPSCGCLYGREAWSRVCQACVGLWRVLPTHLASHIAMRRRTLSTCLVMLTRDAIGPGSLVPNVLQHPPCRPRLPTRRTSAGPFQQDQRTCGVSALSWHRCSGASMAGESFVGGSTARLGAG